MTFKGRLVRQWPESTVGDLVIRGELGTLFVKKVSVEAKDDADGYFAGEGKTIVRNMVPTVDWINQELPVIWSQYAAYPMEYASQIQFATQNAGLNWARMRRVELEFESEGDPCAHESALCALGIQCFSDPVTSAGPISLHRGEKREVVTDLDVNTPAGKMAFTRSYRQFKQGDTAAQMVLGAGWSHNHHIYLKDLSVSGEIHAYLEDGGRAYFTEDPDDNIRYVAMAGGTSEILIDTGSTDARYTLVATDQTFIFNADGKLTKRQWSTGEEWTYSYYATGFAQGLLEEVNDSYGRKLQFSYKVYNGPALFDEKQLWRVGDQTASGLTGTSPSGRYVEFGYTENKIEDSGNPGTIIDGGVPLLSSIQDVRGQTWQYSYEQTNLNTLNFLTRYTSPATDVDGDGSAEGSIILKDVTYTLVGGAGSDVSSIVQQQGGFGTDPYLRQEDFAFQPSGQNITIETVAGRVTTHRFNAAGYEGSEDPAGNLPTRFVDPNHRPSEQTDAKGNTTKMGWSMDGKQLTYVEDALGNATQFVYDDENRLIASYDPEGRLLGTETDNAGRKTEYAYIGTSRQPDLIRVVYIDDTGTTVLRRQEFDYDSQGRTTEERLVDPTDEATVLRRTTRTYGSTGNSNGLLESITIEDMMGSDDETTSYTYDAAGRVIKSYKSSLSGTCQYTYTVFDAAGNVLGSACGLTDAGGSVPTDITELLALYDANDATKKHTRVTLHEYDEMGRRVLTTSNAGSTFARSTRTIYDALSRPIRVIQNYTAQGSSAPGAWVWSDANSRWEDGSGNPISHGSKLDENIINDTGYNARGLVNLRRDVLGRVTLYGYDLVDRQVRTIQNASTPGYDSSYATGDPDLSAYTPNTAVDEDVITDQLYDANGNVVKTVDARGSVTLTALDALNRPVKVIQNAAQPSYDILSDPDLSSYGSYGTEPDLDMVSETEYDKLSRVIRTRRLLENSAGEVWDVTLQGYDLLGRQVRTVQHAATPSYDISADQDLSVYAASLSSNVDQDHLTERRYDEQDRVLETVDINGRVTRPVYDGLNRQVMSIQNYVANGVDPKNWVWSSVNNRWENGSGVAIDHGAGYDQNIITATEYGGDGRVFETRNIEGLINRNAYDAAGRMALSVQNFVDDSYQLPNNWVWESGQWKDGSSGTTIDRGTGYDQNIISQPTYDDQNRTVETRDVRGNVSRQVFDPDSNRRVMSISNYVSNGVDPINWVWDSGDQRWENGSGTAIDLGSDSDQNRISFSEYDLLGRVFSTRDAAGRVNRTVFDALGRQVMMVRNFVAQATEPENWVWSVANDRWEDGSGNPISHGTDFDQNIISTTTYNKAGQVVSSRDARGTQTSFAYDDAGRRLTVAQAVDTSLETLSYTGYDKAGRVRRSIQNYVPDGVNDPDEQDDDGDWLFAPTSHGTDNDQNRITEYIYDAASRRVEVIDPLGNSQETAYRKDGQVESVTNADDKVTRYRYDARNRRTLVVQNHQDNSVDPEHWIWSSTNSRWEDGSSSAIIHGTENDQNIIVQVGYDLAGRMISLRDPRGNETTYEYDRLGRRTKLTNPLSEEWLTAYEEVAQTNRTVMTYPGLATGGSYDVTRTFDKMGRLKEIDYGDPTSTPTVNFTHDILGNRLTMEEIGASSQTVRETIFGYDAANRLNQVEFDSDGDSSVEDTVAYSYDQGGLRTQLTINGSLTIGYEYDEKGQLVKLTDWDSQETDFDYDDAGRHILTQRPNDVESVYSYDVMGRLAQITHQDVSGTPDVLAEYIYAVNALGNRTQAVEKMKSGGSLQQTTIDYTYDALQRLIEADYDSGSTVYDYGYDVAGNLVNNNGVTRTYNAANQMVNDGTNPLTYDANGNLTATDYGWDRANRMVSAPGGTAYAYDGLGNRVQQTVSSVVTDYLLDVQPGLVKVLRETTGANSNHYIHGPRGIHMQSELSASIAGSVWGSFNWGDGSLWGGTVTVTPSNQGYLLQDGLGSVRALADNSAALTQIMDFSPYGVPQGSYGTGFGFTGEYTDANDLLYLRARYYAPEMGVFTALDPWEGKTCTPMSLNGYSWVEGNTINRVDPTGMQSDCSLSPCALFSGQARELCERYFNFLPVCDEGITGCEGQDTLHCTPACYPRTRLGYFAPVIPGSIFTNPCVEGSGAPEDRKNCAIQAYRAAQLQFWGADGFTWPEFLSLTITGEISNVLKSGTICGGTRDPESGVPAGDCNALFWRGAEAVVRKLLYVKCPTGVCTTSQFAEFLGETQAWYNAALGSGEVVLDQLIGSGSGPSLQYSAFIDNVSCYLVQGLPSGPVEWGNIQSQSVVDQNSLTLNQIEAGTFTAFDLAYKEVRAIAAIEQESGYVVNIPLKAGDSPQVRSLFVLQYGVGTDNTVKSSCSPV